MSGPDRVPWAVWTPLGVTGGTITGTARKITLHTMECRCWPTYSGGSTAPHLSVDPATGQARQHLDLSRSGYALASPGAPNSPNMNAGTNIQIEIQGYAADTPGYDDAWYAQLAQWVGWLCDAWGIPKSFPFPFTGSDGYGQDGAVRQPWSAFQPASGIVAHANATWNEHWDAGALSQSRILQHLDPATPPSRRRRTMITIRAASSGTINILGASFGLAGIANQTDLKELQRAIGDPNHVAVVSDNTFNAIKNAVR